MLTPMEVGSNHHTDGLINVIILSRFLKNAANAQA